MGRLLLVSLLLAGLLAACSSGSDTGSDAGDPSAGSGEPEADVSSDARELPAGSREPDDDVVTRPAGSLTWTGCGGLECARLTVPLDHDDPDGATIELAVARALAAEPDERVGALLLNPGGPGGSAVEFLEVFARVGEPELRDRFDLVAVDPRGVGGSTPLECGWILDADAFDADYASDDPERRLDAVLDEVLDQARRCEDTAADLLRHMGTEAVARDMDLLRQALGEEQIHYLGLSYGTLIGAVYADLFGPNLRAAVLDGADSVDPAPTDVLDQYASFEVVFDSFAASAWDSGAADAAVARIDDLLGQGALPAGDDRVLTRDELYTALVASLYDTSQWRGLRTALEEALDGDGRTLQGLVDQYLAQASFEAFTAVVCADDPSRPGRDEILALAAEGADRLEVFEAIAVDAAVGCHGWPEAVDPLVLESPAGVDAGPIAVVGTTNDPATPYAWSVDMADRLATGVLWTHEGDVHTAWFSSECIRGAAVELLVTAEPPAPLTC